MNTRKVMTLSIPLTVLAFPAGAVADGMQNTSPAQRFEAVLDGAAVLDRQTGLVWEKSPATSPCGWAQTHDHCGRRLVGNRSGWRVPTTEELGSLGECGPVVGMLTPPKDHPFGIVDASYYWSAAGRSAGLLVPFGADHVLPDDGTVTGFVWCVQDGPFVR